MKVRLGLIVLAACAIAGLATASAMSLPKTSAPARGWPSGCPAHPVRSTGWSSLDLARAAKAVHTQLPRVFRGLTSQGHVASHGGGISALVATYGAGYGPGGSPPPLKGTQFYLKAAVRACGRAVARASLVAFIQFPQCQLACSYNFAYITETRPGWYMWTSYRI